LHPNVPELPEQEHERACNQDNQHEVYELHWLALKETPPQEVNERSRRAATTPPSKLFELPLRLAWRRFLAAVAEIRVHRHTPRSVEPARFARDPAQDHVDEGAAKSASLRLQCVKGCNRAARAGRSAFIGLKIG
jgi:hypothetical protein